MLYDPVQNMYSTWTCVQGICWVTWLKNDWKNVESKAKLKHTHTNLVALYSNYSGVWQHIMPGQQIYEPPLDKTNNMACAPSEDSDQPGHSPSLIRFFTVRMKKAWVLRYPMSTQRRLWSDWADAQADQSLRWVHSHFVDFVMRRPIYSPIVFIWEDGSIASQL